MKKMKRFASAALAALLLAGSVPSALALDSTPPMYEQFGYGNGEEFMEDRGWVLDVLTYDQASDYYRQHLDAIHKNPQLALDYDGQYTTLAELDQDIALGYWESREEFYRNVAFYMVGADDYEQHCQLSVQLDGSTVHFPDAGPEKVNGRVMAPFRAIAEALGAEVGYDAGKVTAKKDGQTLSFTLGGKQFTVTDSAGKTVRTAALDTVPYNKSGRTYVPVRFFAEAFGLNAEWDQEYQTAVLYDRNALVSELDGEFSVLSQWIKAQPTQENAKALRSVATINAVYTAFDTIDGNKDYKVNAKVEIVADGKTTDATVTVDLRVLAEYLRGQEMPDDVLSAAAMATLKTALSDVKAEILCDAENGSLYLRCPALAKVLLLDGSDNDDLKKLANGAWLHIDWSDVLFGMGLDEQMDALREMQFTSIGESLVAAEENRIKTSEYCYWENLWENVWEEADDLGTIFADDLFTRSGSRYTAKLDKQDEWSESHTTGSYTLNVADGSFSGSIENRAENWGDTTKTAMTFSGNLQNCKLKVTYHQKNTGILVLDLTLTSAETNAAPRSAPPEGSTIVEWTQEGYSDEDAEADMSDFMQPYM